MYGYQIKRLLIRFCGLIITIIIFMTAATFIKNYYLFNNVTSFYYDSDTSDYLDELIQASEDLSLDERYEYIYDIQEQIFAKYEQDEDYTAAIASNEGSINNKLEAVNQYIESLDNAYTVNGVIQYCKTGRGIVSANIPADLIKNQAFYASLDSPTVVNEQPFFIFLELFSTNLTPIYVILLIGFFSADGYEKQIDKIINISYNSNLFYRSREIVLSLAVFVIYTLNFVIDLLVSGAALQAEYINASIQSAIMFLPTNSTIFEVIVWLFFLGLLHTFICYNLFIVLARKCRSIRLYLILSGSLVIICSVASTYFTDLSQYLFFGISNKTYMLMGLEYFNRISCCEMTISVLVSFTVLALLIINRALSKRLSNSCKRFASKL